jgi:hypothetical protein
MFLGSRERPVRRADNLTAICELILWTMWNPRHLTTLYASTVCYGDSFTVQRLQTQDYTLLPRQVTIRRRAVP